ncbi:peroxisomal membrane anchor protein conserved region-domain-containing protein [Lipomyces oligophaga]|uniref:peroxisomal membrane anchor protein conserved region-domain-containing protein n=1 Tax=Lipomyces oligophaga TaxID=45792 RepID=UPI0034CFDEC0
MAALREDLIVSAVAFLVDPKAAESPLAQRIQFLESKGLTQAEIAEALRRSASLDAASITAASPSSTTTATASQPVSPTTLSASSSLPPRPTYYPGQQYAQQAPPVPRRDWKDMFVMATATAGITYGLWFLAKKYVVPLITPPPPSALEADRDALTAEFERTDALLAQLQTDMSDLKTTEKEHLEALDTSLSELDSVLLSAKSQIEARERDIQALKTEIETLKEDLPGFLERTTGSQRRDVLDLKNEIKSLKQILSNRLRPATSPQYSSAASNAGNDSEPSVVVSAPTNASSSSPTPTLPSSTLLPPSRTGIPAWQLAAAKSSPSSPNSPVSIASSASTATSTTFSDAVANGLK